MKNFITASLALFLIGCGTVTQLPEDNKDAAIDVDEGVVIEETPVTETTTFRYDMAELAKHSSKDSCWTLIDGAVYDLTSWISQHPGGAENILKLCGIDGSSAFTAQHGENVKAKDTLKSFYLSDLES